METESSRPSVGDWTVMSLNCVWLVQFTTYEEDEEMQRHGVDKKVMVRATDESTL